jgi:hypothetical protein
MNQRLQPPSGMPPPQRVTSPNGDEIDLVNIAQATCMAYHLEFPDERERYGTAGEAWCRHDAQHLLNWAVLSLTRSLDFEGQLAWLAQVLEARNFPLPRLARCLELLADATRHTIPEEPQVATRLESGAAYISSRGSFLS